MAARTSPNKPASAQMRKQESSAPLSITRGELDAIARICSLAAKEDTGVQIRGAATQSQFLSDLNLLYGLFSRTTPQS